MTNGPDQDQGLQGNAEHVNASAMITMVIHGGFKGQFRIPDYYALSLWKPYNPRREHIAQAKTRESLEFLGKSRLTFTWFFQILIYLQTVGLIIRGK